MNVSGAEEKVSSKYLSIRHRTVILCSFVFVLIITIHCVHTKHILHFKGPWRLPNIAYFDDIAEFLC